MHYADVNRTTLTFVRLLNPGNNHRRPTRRQNCRRTDNHTEGTLGYVLITDNTPCGHSLYLLEGGATRVGGGLDWVGWSKSGMEGMEGWMEIGPGVSITSPSVMTTSAAAEHAHMPQLRVTLVQ